MTQVAIANPTEIAVKKPAPKKTTKKVVIKPKRKAVAAPKGWTIDQEEALLAAIKQDAGNMQKEFLRYSKQLKKEGTPRTQGSVQAKFYELVNPNKRKGARKGPKLEKPYAYKKVIAPRKKKKAPGVTIGNAKTKDAGPINGQIKMDIKSIQIRNNQIIFTY